MTAFETRNNQRTYDTDTHKVVPKDAVVLDLDGYRHGFGDTSELLDRLRDQDIPALATREWIADQIEAQTKPPRIPEPGWGSVVEAGVKEHDKRLQWTPLSANHWHCRDLHEYARRWDELIDPALIRPGIEDAHCEGHGGPGRWYCCQHPDAGWPCTETVEGQS